MTHPARTSFCVAGNQVIQEPDRLILRPGSGLGLYILVTSGCIALLLGFIGLVVLAMAFATTIGGWILAMGLPVFGIALSVALWQQKQSLREPLILDRLTDRYLVGSRMICPLTQIEYIAIERPPSARFGHVSVYPVLYSGDCSMHDFGFPVIRPKQERAYADLIASFLNVEVRVVPHRFRANGGP